MKKFLKRYIDLLIAIIWFCLLIFHLLDKNFNDALMSFIIAVCSAEIYIIKQELTNKKLKSEEKI